MVQYVTAYSFLQLHGKLSLDADNAVAECEHLNYGRLAQCAADG